MLLEFNQVSFSYLSPSQRKKWQKKASAAPEQWGAKPFDEWALEDISFAVNEGEILGIAGHTGSGKSTLIQHMNGLLHPTVGRVLFKGEDLADKRVATQARGHVGIVFQSPENQLFAQTVYDDVAFGPRNMKIPEEEIRVRVSQALSTVGLSDSALLERSPFELSGGQQRRVAFAGVLSMQPDVLVLDEPVAGLDPQSRNEFLALIGRLKDREITIVLVSHSMEDLASLCDRVLLLSEGRIFALGTPEEVFHNAQQLHDIGLALPDAQAFAEELRAAGFHLPRTLYSEDTLADDIASFLSCKQTDGQQVTLPVMSAADKASNQLTSGENPHA